MSGKQNNNYGIVYVLTNPVMPGLVKIGMTTRDNLDTRMKELYGTGVPVPFKCEYACKVKSSDCAKIEKALHVAFAPDRINANREFLQSAFMGVHKYAVKWAADAGIRYDFNTDGHNNNLVYAQAEFDYYPMDNLAVGVYGDYKIGGATVDSGYENDEIHLCFTVAVVMCVFYPVHTIGSLFG